MFHMLTCFDLRPGGTLADFHTAYGAFVEHLAARGLVEGTGPIGRRQANCGLDTDAERSQQYFVVMRFANRAQADTALAHVRPRADPTERIHRDVYRRVHNLIFICWEDVEDG